MAGRLKDRTILTTGSAHKGATQLLGVLAAETPNIAICAEFNLKARAKKLTEGGSRAMSVPVQWGAKASIEAGFKRVIEEFGSIDAIVHISPSHLGFAPGSDAPLEIATRLQKRKQPFVVYYWDSSETPPPGLMEVPLIFVEENDAISLRTAADIALKRLLEHFGV